MLTKAKTGVTWRTASDGRWAPFTEKDNREVRLEWAPQPGSQEVFLDCPLIECLYSGTRGPGKTDALLMDFCQDVGVGWGAEWRGVIFRRTYPELQDVIEKARKWISLCWPTAKYNEAKSFWEWQTGERLYFRHFPKPSAYWGYHGHAYPWIGWEELTTWPDDKCFKSMFSCSRSTSPGMPRKIRATTNPYGVGHNWVKARYRLPIAPGKLMGTPVMDAVDDQGSVEPPRVAVQGFLDENQVLLKADPDYKSRIRAAARNRAEREAWLYGSWDIVAGGMFDDLWLELRDKVVLKPFPIPQEWRIDRAMDWGSSKPSSVGWWAESNGDDVELPDGRCISTVRGDLFRIAEWYTWSGKENEGTRQLATDLAKGIVERELKMGLHGRVKVGPADPSIFDEENGVNIARDMARPVRIDTTEYSGVMWRRADKGPGSRKQGWEQVRKRLSAVQAEPGAVREQPGLFIFDTCTHWLRTVPSLPRDEKDPDDVDTEAEDHAGDETRYRVRQVKRKAGQGRSTGDY